MIDSPCTLVLLLSFHLNLFEHKQTNTIGCGIKPTTPMQYYVTCEQKSCGLQVYISVTEWEAPAVIFYKKKNDNCVVAK